MNLFLFSTFVLVVWSNVCLGNKSVDEAFKVLRFEHTRYAMTIKENHKVGCTISFFVKAHGCKDVSYKVQESYVPFTVNERSGRICLKKPLNYDEDTSHSFIVLATSTDKTCFNPLNSPAKTIVEVEVVNVNVHRPKFEAEKHTCRIDEKTGQVKIFPTIKVKDLDTGNAGKIRNVQVRESVEPFELELKEKTGEVLVRPLPGYKFDADRLSFYKFSLQAWDAGMPQKNSRPLHMLCKVVAQNKHAPIFSKREYIGRVREGANGASIMKVEATDADTNPVFGKVCEYFIRTSDIPFSISNSGIITLDKPLPQDAPDNYVFAIMAKDCGGTISKEAAMVNVIVDKDCVPELIGPKERSPTLKGCDGRMPLTPQVQLNKCGKSRQYANFSAIVSMETNHILKGCDRETYEASGVFKMCNVKKTIDLLPFAKKNLKWMAGLSRDQSLKDDVVYKFDGKTAVDIPSDIFSYNGIDTITVSTWIWMKKPTKRQTIIAGSDEQRLDRKHFALFTQGDQLVFIHRQEKNTGGTLCKSYFTWKPTIFDHRWHHVVVTTNGCKAARLFVDSKEIQVVQEKSDWPLHGSHLGQHVVVGARWLGREMKYDDHFDGYLSGLSVNIGEAVSEKAIKCVYECKEKIKIDIPTPDGFEVKQKTHGLIEIDGQGPPESFEKLLSSLIYINTRQTPTKGYRLLQIQASINKQPLSMITMDIMVEAHKNEKITLLGGGKRETTADELRKYGIPVARNVNIIPGKCTKYINSARIEVEPPLTDDESLINSGPEIGLYNVQKEILPAGRGFVVHGLAKIEEYQSILRDIVYVHLAPTKEIYHKFKLFVSDLNSHSASNIIEIELTTGTKPHFDMQVIDRQAKDSMPGAVTNEIFVAQSSGKSLGVIIGVIIASSCFFVFIILVIVIRLRGVETSIVYTDVPENEAEVSDGDTSVMNVTMNPLEKLEKIGVPESENPPDDKPKAKNERMTLEWDDAYIA